MMIKKLLKKHRYPPEGMDDAVQTVMTQCELWTDNADMEQREHKAVNYSFRHEQNLSMVAEEPAPYGKKRLILGGRIWTHVKVTSTRY